MKNYYILFLLLGLLSCREEIFLELEAADEKIVVEGHIESGFPPYLILSKNQGYFDPLDSNTFSNIFVYEADVVVYKIENNIETKSSLYLENNNINSFESEFLCVSSLFSVIISFKIFSIFSSFIFWFNIFRKNIDFS